MTDLGTLDVIGRLIPALAVVAALPLIAMWWSRSRRGEPGQRIRVTAKAPLGKATWVAVVEVDGRRFLVGTAERGVGLLAELEATPLPEPVPATAGVDDFVETDGPRRGLISRLREMTLRRASTDRGPHVDLGV